MDGKEFQKNLHYSLIIAHIKRIYKEGLITKAEYEEIIKSLNKDYGYGMPNGAVNH